MRALRSQAFHLHSSLRSGGEVLIAITSNNYVILNTDSSDGPIPLEDIGINVFAELCILEEWVDDETAKVNL